MCIRDSSVASTAVYVVVFLILLVLLWLLMKPLNAICLLYTSRCV